MDGVLSTINFGFVISSLFNPWNELTSNPKLERETVSEEPDEVASQPHLTPPSGERKHKRTRSGTQSHRSRSGTNRSRSGTHRSHSRRPSIRNVIDEGQTAEEDARPRSAPHGDGEKFEFVARTRSFSVSDSLSAGGSIAKGKNKEGEEKIETVIPPSESGTTRPFHDGIAYPFKLKVPETKGAKRNSSIITLHSDGDDERDVDEADGISREGDKDTGENSIPGRPPIERFVTAKEEL